MIISLCGFMGTGKTGVGKALAATLEKKGYPFELIDLDSYIESKQGCTVSELFTAKGEAFFRDEEYHSLVEITDRKKNTILSLGGGTPTFERCNRIIKEKTTCIYLDCTVGELAYRLVGTASKRPLVAKAMMDGVTGKYRPTKEERLKNLERWVAEDLEKRAPWYIKCSSFSVESTVWDKPAIVSEIIRQLKQRKG